MDQKISRESEEYLPVPLSGADPVGVLYTNGSVFLRGIHECGIEQIQNLLKSEFWAELSRRKVIPKTRILDRNLIPDSMQHFPLVLEHETLSPVTYPHEWSFEMVKTAGLAFLDIVELADKYGYTCKDAHLYNWLFRGTQPVWVDIGSFMPLPSSTSNTLPWLESFYSNVLTPLTIWSDGMPFLANRAIGCPARLFSIDDAIAYNHALFRGQGMLVRNLRFVFRVLFFANSIPENTTLRRGVKHLFMKKPSRKIIQLRNKIQKIFYATPSSWGQYHDEYFDKNNKIKADPRFTRISELIQAYSPSSILDLAGNAGVLSQLIAERLPEVHIICTDYDSNAIDHLYHRIQKHPLSNLSMAVHDFMSPESNSSEKNPQNRFKSDCVIALAVTHHLLLSQGYQYDQIFKIIGSYSNRIVFIEYMPLGLHDGHQSPQLPHWYTQENFEKSFSKFFTLLHTEQLDINRVLFIGQVRANNIILSP